MLLHAHSGIARKIPGGVWGGGSPVLAGPVRLSACRVGFAVFVAPAHTPAERSGKYLALISNRSLQDLNAI
jgi:hypothetical protein